MAYTYKRIGGEFTVNTTTAGRQRAESTSYLTSGGFVITWLDEAGPNFMEIRGQLYDSSGTPVGAEFLVNSNSANDQDMSSVTALASGGFLVTWRDNSGVGGDSDSSAVKAQLFNAAGAKVGSEFLVNTDIVGAQRIPDAVQLASGNILLTWTSNAEVKAQLFTDAGVKIGSEFLVNSTTANTQLDSAVAALASGGFVISWTDTSGLPDDGRGIRAQRFDSAGAKVGGEFLVNTTTSGDQTNSDIASLVSGGFVAVWEDFPGHAWAQMFDASGNKVGSEISLETVAGSTQSSARVVGLAFGGFAVTWTESGKDGSFSGIILQVFDSAGARLGTEMVVNQVTDNIQSESNIAVLPSGDLVISWSDFSQQGGDSSQIGVKAQIVRPFIPGTESGDDLSGTADGDYVEAFGGNDLIRLQAGGDDSVNGGGGNDVFLFGATLTSADSVNGGIGLDQVAIQGDYSAGLTLGANFLSIESFAILPGSDTRFGDTAGNFYDYNLTTLNANVAPGVLMIIDANRLRAGEDFTFNGSAETDGNFFIYGGGGTDTLLGGSNNDTFYFGENGQFGATDHVDGGVSGIDQLGLRGNYTIVFGANQLTSIESIGMVSAQDTRFGALGSSYNYNLTMNDGNVAAGVLMTVDAAPLRPSETLTFNGSAELDGAFRVFGGQGADTITGGQGNDILVGRGGADTMNGGGGADQFRYNGASDSTSVNYDRIVGFDYYVDRLDLPGEHDFYGNLNGGTLNSGSSFDSDMAAAMNGVLNPTQAIFFAVTNGTLSGSTFLVVDQNGVAGYQAGEDFVIDVTNSPTLGVISDFIV